MKMTPTKLKALRGIKEGYYKVRGERSIDLKGRPRVRWNVVGPESVAATSLLRAGLIGFNRETMSTYLTTSGLCALETANRAMLP